MHEREEIEQYFFDEPTLDHLARLAAQFEFPCCLCTPSLGVALYERGISARTLDVDDRFSWLPGFRLYDISSPFPLGETYGLIICDPPFLNVPLSAVFNTLTVLSRGDFSQPLLVNYLTSRSPMLLRTLEAFGLGPTGYRPGYRSIQNVGRNLMELFGNLDSAHPVKPQPTSLLPAT
jgi:hypothetical protein